MIVDIGQLALDRLRMPDIFAVSVVVAISKEVRGTSGTAVATKL